MLGIGTWELVIIFAIVLVLFGGKRLPSLATGLGLAIRNFKTALKSEDESIKGKIVEENPPSSTPKKSSRRDFSLADDASDRRIKADS